MTDHKDEKEEKVEDSATRTATSVEYMFNC